MRPVNKALWKFYLQHARSARPYKVLFFHASARPHFSYCDGFTGLSCARTSTLLIGAKPGAALGVAGVSRPR